MVCQITVHSSIDKYKQEWSQSRESTFCCWRNLYFFDFVVYLHQIISGQGKKRNNKTFFQDDDWKKSDMWNSNMSFRWNDETAKMSCQVLMVHTSSLGVLAPGLSAQTNNKKSENQPLPYSQGHLLFSSFKRSSFLSSNYTWNLLIRYIEEPFTNILRTDTPEIFHQFGERVTRNVYIRGSCLKRFSKG